MCDSRIFGGFLWYKASDFGFHYILVTVLARICIRRQLECVLLVNYAWVLDAGQQPGQDDFGTIDGKTLDIGDLLKEDFVNPKDIHS